MLFPSVLLAALSLTAADPSPVVEGALTDAAGRPVAGAAVILAESIDWRTPWADAGHAPRANVIRRTTTDAAGHFHIALPTEPHEGYGRAKPLTLWAYQPGRPLLGRSIPPDWPPNAEPLRLTLGDA